MSDSLQIPALGLPFRLGMLYNQHKEELISGISLWSEFTLAEHVAVRDQWSYQPSTIIENDDISTKSKSLEIPSNLKISLLAGMLKPEGAAKYLYDRKSSSRQVRVAVKYSCTTHCKEICMEHINIMTTHPDIEKSGATHVVSKVVYGSDAFLVFNQECRHGEDLHKIEGKIKSSVKFVEGLSIGLSGGDYIDNNDCVMILLYGDVPIGDISSRKDAYSTIRAKIMELRQAKEQSVVKTVFLYPLSRLNSINWQVPKVFPVGNVIALHTEEILECVHIIQTELSDLQKRKEYQKFGSVCAQIQLVSRYIEQFEAKFKSELSKSIGKVRFSGDMQILENLIQSVKDSPFSNTNLKVYIQNKECEFDILMQQRNSISELQLPQDIVFPCTQSDRLHLIYDINVENVICLYLNLTPLQTSLMKKMAQYLQHSMVMSDPTTPTTDSPIPNDTVLAQMNNTPDDAVDLNNIDISEWFQDTELTSQFINMMRKFRTFVMDNKNNRKLRIVVSENEDRVIKRGPKLLQYTSGRQSDIFVLPGPTKSPKIVNVGCNSIKLSLYERNDDGIKPTSWHIHYLYASGKKIAEKSTNETVITLSSLWSNTLYYIRAQAVYSNCTCPESEEVTVKTQNRLRSLFRQKVEGKS